MVPIFTIFCDLTPLEYGGYKIMVFENVKFLDTTETRTDMFEYKGGIFPR